VRPLDQLIAAMPKVELHVHLEGSIRPETLLELARRHRVQLPASPLDEVRAWYNFRDFDHFIEVYGHMSSSIRSIEDIEFVAREFLSGQAAQGIRYSEVTYTPFTHYRTKGLAFREQLAALNRARAWAEAELGVSMRLVLDFARKASLEEANTVADWAIESMGDGVVALGLGGVEAGYSAAKFKAVFERARAAGLARTPHAGETVGADSIWSVLRALDRGSRASQASTRTPDSAGSLPEQQRLLGRRAKHCRAPAAASARHRAVCDDQLRRSAHVQYHAH
jgi:aminodeoxyfutalosine deaminase